MKRDLASVGLRQLSLVQREDFVTMLAVLERAKSNRFVAALVSLERAGSSDAFFRMCSDIQMVRGIESSMAVIVSLADAMSSERINMWSDFHLKLRQLLCDIDAPLEAKGAYQRLQSFIEENEDLSRG